MASGGGAAPGPALAPNQGGTGPVIVFDWDCTITCKHMFKVLAGWPGYCEPFSEWCGQQGIPDPLKTPMRDSICERMVSSAQLSSAAALARLVHQGFGGDEEQLRKCMIEYFMGGEARTARIKALLTELRETHGCRLCVLTRGETASLRIFFEKVVPDWSTLFEGGWIANTFNDYFTASPADGGGGHSSLSLQTPNLSTVGRYGECTKEMILEAVFPFTEELVMLVDDSVSRGGSLVASTAPGEKGGNISLLDLPMEREGLDETSIALLLNLVGGEGGLAEFARAKEAAGGGGAKA